MTRRRPHGNARRKGTVPVPGVHRDDFPALTSFFRGYLHEDLAEVHGSIRAAARAFCADANPDERRQLARELEALVSASAAWSRGDLRRFVTRVLASRWEPESRDELTQLLDLIRTAI